MTPEDVRRTLEGLKDGDKLRWRMTGSPWTKVHLQYPGQADWTLCKTTIPLDPKEIAVNDQIPVGTPLCKNCGAVKL